MSNGVISIATSIVLAFGLVPLLVFAGGFSTTSSILHAQGNRISNRFTSIKSTEKETAGASLDKSVKYTLKLSGGYNGNSGFASF